MTWVRRAGILARERMHQAIASRKEDRSVVTDVDHAVQDMLLEAIAQRYPDDAVLAEETQKNPARHAAAASARRCWIIDPIDGTRNFVRKMPMFTVSVAMFEAGSPAVGLVYQPMTDQMYSASAGGGAWLQDEQIATREVFSTSDLFIGLPSGREEALPPPVHRWIDEMVMRATGSTALNLALLAAGCLDAVFASRCHLWDMAAGALLVEEAGALIRRYDGKPFFPIDLATYTSQATPFLAARRELLERLRADWTISLC